MFEEDRGDEKIRRTVFGYVLTWQQSETWKGRENRIAK